MNSLSTAQTRPATGMEEDARGGHRFSRVHVFRFQARRYARRGGDKLQSQSEQTLNKHCFRVHVPGRMSVDTVDSVDKSTSKDAAECRGAATVSRTLRLRDPSHHIYVVVQCLSINTKLRTAALGRGPLCPGGGTEGS